MKISEVTISDLKKYANVFHNEDDALFTAILIACKAYIVGYTGLPLVDDGTGIDNLDRHEDITICLFVLANEMYDNRAYNIETAKANIVIKSILQMHSTNLL